MYIKTFVFNPLQENTYLVVDEKSGFCMVIDAGCLATEEQQQLVDYITNHKLTLKYVLNTHLHLDHCFGNECLFQQFGVAPLAHADDEYQLNNMVANARIFGIPYQGNPQALAGYLKDGDQIDLAGLIFTVIHIPGHSPGSVAFYCKSENCLFSGDTLFKRGIGRADLPGGDYKALIRSLIQKLMILPNDTDVYCGHGLPTTIGEERDENPYL